MEQYDPDGSLARTYSRLSLEEKYPIVLELCDPDGSIECSARAEEECIREEAFDILERKRIEICFSKLYREVQQKIQFPLPGPIKYMKLVYQDKEYRENAPKISLFATSDEKCSNYIKMLDRGKSVVESIWTGEQIKAVVKASPDILRNKKDALNFILLEDFRQWLFKEFTFVNECPFCNMKFLSEFLARKHIDKEHSTDYAEDTLNEYYQ